MTEISKIFESHPDAASFFGPHEFHVTTDPNSTDIDLFRRTCGYLGVKPHIIFNETPSGEASVDYLTGSEEVCSSAESLVELGRIATGLKHAGLTVVREKIETTPWHPLAPRLASGQLPIGSYFESHFTLPDLPTLHGRTGLKWKEVPLLISTTETKRLNGLLFATLRHYSTNSTDFYRNIEELYTTLSAQIELDRPTIEFAMIDSNPSHDKLWVEAYEQTHLTDIEPHATL